MQKQVTENLENISTKNSWGKKEWCLIFTLTFPLKGFPTKHTNIKYKYETEGQIQHNSNNVLTVEIKMTDKKNRIILTIINMLT